MDDGVKVLPDGSAFFTAKRPLPEDHWIYQECGDPPKPWNIAIGHWRKSLSEQIREAGRYAVRAATQSGTDMDFDPDALIQNLVVGFLGYHTSGDPMGEV